MRVGAAGRLDAHPELTLSLVYDPAAIANGRALAFLAAVKSLLEEPHHLLAG